MLRLEEVATVENVEIRQQLRHLVLPITSLALSGHQVANRYDEMTAQRNPAIAHYNGHVDFMLYC